MSSATALWEERLVFQTGGRECILFFRFLPFVQGEPFLAFFGDPPSGESSSVRVLVSMFLDCLQRIAAEGEAVQGEFTATGDLEIVKLDSVKSSLLAAESKLTKDR